MIKFLIASALALFSIQSKANNECIKNGYDICSEAKELTRQISNTLPSKMGGNYYTYHSASNFYNNIIIDAYLPYPKEKYQKEFEKYPDTYGKIVENIEYIVNDLCTDHSKGNIFYDFISRGGKFTYIYKYPDNTVFHTKELMSCKK